MDLDHQCIDFILILRPIWNKINALTYIALSHILATLCCIALNFSYKNINVKSMYDSVKLPLLTNVYIYMALKHTLKSTHWTYFESKSMHLIALSYWSITMPCFTLPWNYLGVTILCHALNKVKKYHIATLWYYYSSEVKI